MVSRQPLGSDAPGGASVAWGSGLGAPPPPQPQPQPQQGGAPNLGAPENAQAAHPTATFRLGDAAPAYPDATQFSRSQSLSLSQSQQQQQGVPPHPSLGSPKRSFKFATVSQRDVAPPDVPQSVAALEDPELREAFLQGVRDAPDIAMDEVHEEVPSDNDVGSLRRSASGRPTRPARAAHKPRLEEIYIRLERHNEPLGAVLEANRVTAVNRGSPAHKGGLKKGDVIHQIDEDPIASFADITRALGRRRPSLRGAALNPTGCVGHVLIIQPKRIRKHPLTARQRDARAKRMEAKRRRRKMEREAQGFDGMGNYVTSSSSEEAEGGGATSGGMGDRRGSRVYGDSALNRDPPARSAMHPSYDRRRRRRKTSPGWASVRLSLVRAALTFVLSVLCFILWVTSELKEDCNRQAMSAWMLLNCFLLLAFAALTIASSSMCTRHLMRAAGDGKPGDPPHKPHSRYTARPALAVSLLLFLWCFIWIIVQFYNLSDSTEQVCGSIYSSVKAMVGVQFAFIGLIFLCFCSMYTQTTDDEEAADMYRSYSPPRGVDRRVGRVL